MFLSVDRIEGKFAVCSGDDKEVKNISLDMLPKNISEGDIFFCEKGEYIIDEEETLARQKESFNRMNKLMKKD